MQTIDEFLESGGKITFLPMGASGEFRQKASKKMTAKTPSEKRREARDSGKLTYIGTRCKKCKTYKRLVSDSSCCRCKIKLELNS